MKNICRITVLSAIFTLAFVVSTGTSFAAPNILNIKETVKENIEKNRSTRNESLEAPQKSFIELATTSISNLINIETRIYARTEESDVNQKNTDAVYSNLIDAENSIQQASSTLALLQNVNMEQKEAASSTHTYAVQVIGFLEDAKNSLKSALESLKNIL